jgi:hypothetical protein
MVRRPKAVSNHEARAVASSFETRRKGGAPQDEEPDCSKSVNPAFA